MQYYDVITNPTWWTAADMTVVISEYMTEIHSHFDEILLIESDCYYNDTVLQKRRTPYAWNFV